MQASQETGQISAERKAFSAHCKSGGWVTPAKGSVSRPLTWWLSAGHWGALHVEAWACAEEACPSMGGQMGRLSLQPLACTWPAPVLFQTGAPGSGRERVPQSPHPLLCCDMSYRRSRYARSTEKAGTSPGGGQQKPQQKAWPGNPRRTRGFTSSSGSWDPKEQNWEHRERRATPRPKEHSGKEPRLSPQECVYGKGLREESQGWAWRVLRPRHCSRPR